MGTDLVSVAEVRASIARFGERYLSRVFSAREIETCSRGVDAPLRFAARFAAKESALKVLSAPDVGIDWRSIEVTSAHDGAPKLALSGEAARIAREKGFVAFSVSLTHERDYAAAVVVGTRRNQDVAGTRSRFFSKLRRPGHGT